MDCSLPGSSVHEIFQARVLEWVAVSFSRGFSQPRDQTRVSRIAGRCFYHLSHQRNQKDTMRKEKIVLSLFLYTCIFWNFTNIYYLYKINTVKKQKEKTWELVCFSIVLLFVSLNTAPLQVNTIFMFFCAPLLPFSLWVEAMCLIQGKTFCERCGGMVWDQKTKDKTGPSTLSHIWWSWANHLTSLSWWEQVVTELEVVFVKYLVPGPSLLERFSSRPLENGDAALYLLRSSRAYI